MATSRVALRIEKQQRHKLRAIRVHNQRQNPNEKLIINPNNSKENVCAYHKHENLDIDAAVREEISTRYQGSKKLRKDAVVALEFMVSASPQHFRPWDENAAGEYDEEKVNQWLDANLKALKKKFGDNLIQVDLHLDETTPHLHAIVVPVMEKKNSMGETYTTFDAKTLTKKSGIWSYEKMQDYFAEAVADIGINRGIKGSRAVAEQLKELGKLITEAGIEAEQYEVPALGKGMPKRKTVTETKMGIFKQDKLEDDGSFYLRCFKLLKKKYGEARENANKTISGLYKALAKVSHQLEQEKARTDAYRALVKDPEALLEVEKELQQRNIAIQTREDNFDFKEAQLMTKVLDMEDKVQQYETGELITNLRRANQRLTFENEALKEALKPK